jgi:hypothetical protein
MRRKTEFKEDEFRMGSKQAASLLLQNQLHWETFNQWPHPQSNPKVS